MASFIRTTFAGLLCGVILLGHVPAWMHVVQCNHDHQQATEDLLSVESSDSLGCAHGCRHEVVELSAAAIGPAGATETDSGPFPSDREHDHDTCAICQSLVCPTGVQWQSSAAPLGEAILHDSVCLTPTFALPLPASVVRPRGPPSFLA